MAQFQTSASLPQTHILGYPRIGAGRELKFAQEAYWQGRISQAELQQQAQAVEASNWQAQVDAGLSILTVGDFVYYDAILTHAVRLGIFPARFAEAAQGHALNHLDRQYYLARGRAPHGSTDCPDVAALEMTKWFDTNYHYLVPELTADQQFTPDFSDLLAQVERAKQYDRPLKVVVPGLLTFLYLSRITATQDSAAHAHAHHEHDESCVHDDHQPALQGQQETLALVDALLPAYAQLFDQLQAAGVTWIQIDEPILVLDLPQAWKSAFERVYHLLQRRDLSILIATYFGTLGENLNLACHLPVAGLHIDTTREQPNQHFWQQVIDHLPVHKVLSLGVVDGRSVWASDLSPQSPLKQVVQNAQTRLGQRLWLSSGCSLLHVPVDLANEQVPAHVQGKLAFARQKLDELVSLAQYAVTPLALPKALHSSEYRAPSTPSQAATLTPARRIESFALRYQTQQNALQLPLLPTTTIGSFPQTQIIRKHRANWQAGLLASADYDLAMQAEIRAVIEAQEDIGLDVLVHGEAERSDMVEYFAGLLDGFWLSRNGWVQSYGSRCVRPPIITGDIRRPAAMTVRWASYAASLTDKPVKGMLTGPVTILNWSFAPTHGRREVALQIAEAVRLEVADLQAAGISIIQIDEPAFREGLPLRKSDQAAYWQWAVAAFQHAASSADVGTQIHTHMCYSDFTDSLPQISAMDADVITIETSRSGLQLLEIFEQQGYPNAIGPGVYVIHSPRTPTQAQMQRVIDTARKAIPIERLWINPDCGLKTRSWPETVDALKNMVQMAQDVRAQLAN